MKILLSAPTSDLKDYCMKDWIAWICNKDFSNLNYEILIVDNSKDENYHKNILKELKKYDVNFHLFHLKHKKDRNIYDTIAESNEYIRKFAIKYKFDYLFFNESDQFVPNKSLDYLYSKKKSIISLPYFLFHHYASKLISHHVIKAGKTRTIAINSLKKSFIEFDGKVKKDYNTGLGATLIHKNILNLVDFKIDYDNFEEMAFSDTYFQNRLQQKGIDIWQVKKHISLHINQDWNKNINLFKTQ